MNKIKVAFTGWAGSGKTEAAKHLKYAYGCELISFADGIKYVDRYLFGSGVKDRSRLQKIGEFFRSIDPEIWVKRTVESAQEEDDVTIDDLRRLNEYDELLAQGFKIVRIVADEDIRIQRLNERDGFCDASILYNESESGCSELILTEIKNNGSMEDLHLRLDILMEQWGYEKETGR